MTRIVLTFIFALVFELAHADVLLIEEVRQAERMNLPQNGQSKADVEVKFGAPVQKLPAVGDPSISNWKYGKYSVYFEHDLVLFTVLHKGAVIEK